MIKNYFITRRQHLVDNNHPQIEITDSLDLFHEYMKNHDEAGGDTENSSLHPINCVPLLSQFAFRDKVGFVIDKTSIKEDFLSPYKKKKIVGVNLQYDYKVWKWHYGVEFRNLEDIMVTDQILGRGSGRSNSYEAIHLRRLGFELPTDKITRDDFIGMTKRSLFKTEHIIYGGYDAYGPLLIADKQKVFVEQYGLQRRIYAIGQPLIPILGDMSLNGFTLNTTKWTEILNRNKAKKFEIECKLDEIIREFAKTHINLRGGIWTNIRKKQELAQLDFFGTPNIISNENIKNVSYSSAKQLIKLFKILQQPVPQKIDTKAQIAWGEEKKLKDSFDEGALEQYKIKYPTTIVTDFINLLLEYRKYDKAISSFGEIFLKEKVKAGKQKKYKTGYMNPITNKVHTVFKQEFTKNGRLSSGDTKIGFWQSQNMIKEAEYRNCFTLTQKEIDEGWYISTYDLSGAELVILASNSKDKVLIDLISNNKDLHSYLAEYGYNKIISYILHNMSEQRAFDEIAHLTKPNRLQELLLKEVKISETESRWIPYTQQELAEIHSSRINEILRTGKLKINKKSHVDIRDPAKNGHYGINYGAGPSKISETFNFAPKYGELYIEGIEEAIPDGMAYLKKIARFGVQNGYVIFNKRTNSRHWFQTWLEAKQYGRHLSQKDKSAIERACKNYGISGTQADMIKEGMVNIDIHRRENSIPFEWLLQVHDELVFKHQQKDYGEKAGKILTETCNLYLEGIEMKVSGHTGIHWHK